MPDVIVVMLSVIGLILALISFFAWIFDENFPKVFMLGVVPLIWFIVAYDERNIIETREVEPNFIGNDVLFKVDDNYLRGSLFYNRNIVPEDRIIIDTYDKWKFGIMFTQTNYPRAK